ncbi:undecaprenyldiphospho-muramoylpentapeptide beta-N-acetylglucosaminyltransferase [Alteromonas halophila]|uniref:UDP-N-acetylglucosamine--N-acetylmuramyl-(pentapeptide) pyrophosphoryl-undecaprenol N-acetylglucosamine transferase n=1 Tax=Alteromonas halophila TaxID=516698 RepID=A0A918N1K4_9ALTE|nr:undecaprenyldiphospho-muramoylpentapeptide beta-N-acetylglucosaminyltransferase [Alteromonas halophila]GGW94215.1 UDP-N-acetylglucosamine--N-acetylmuramyl-(pentapeptide) pyrophosphoryl-undecaprenol N-acetylglucosamine transferase [Alteromonas halophila]
MTKRCLIMAGGTGGHVFPGLAVADALSAKGWDIQWLGTRERMEATQVPKAGYAIHFIPVSGLRGKGLGGKLHSAFAMLRSIGKARALIKRLKPDVVLGMGGYASGPGGIAAKLCGVPLVIHEQNATAGMTNRLLGRLAQRVMLGFADAAPQFTLHPDHIMAVGNPVRREVLAIKPKDTIEKPLNMLVVGGSLGARPLNLIVPEICKGLDDLHIWHQCGKDNKADVEAAYSGGSVPVTVDEFIDNMADAYAWADFVVCRAGALTVAEVSAAGRAAIFVPLPHAVDDHQTSNALSLVNKKAALLIAQSTLADNLGQAVRQWIQDPYACLKMGELAKQAARQDATEQVVTQCEALAGVGA